MPACYMPPENWHLVYYTCGRNAWCLQGCVVSKPFSPDFMQTGMYFTIYHSTVCVINNRCLQRNKAQLCWGPIRSWLFPAGSETRVRNKSAL